MHPLTFPLTLNFTMRNFQCERDHLISKSKELFLQRFLQRLRKHEPSLIKNLECRLFIFSQPVKLGNKIFFFFKQNKEEKISLILSIILMLATMNIGPGANACALKRKKGGFKRVGTEVPKKGCMLFILNSSASHCSESPWFKEQGGVGKSAPPHPFSPQVLPCLWLNSFENWGENLHPVTLGIQLSDVWAKISLWLSGRTGFDDLRHRAEVCRQTGEATPVIFLE